eukprot:g2156.t1
MEEEDLKEALDSLSDESNSESDSGEVDAHPRNILLEDSLIASAHDIKEQEVYGEGAPNRKIHIAPVNLMLAWGHASYGRLGIGDIEELSTEEIYVPRPVIRGDLRNEKLTSLCTSFVHSVCSAENGFCFSWGGGLNGNLGVGFEKWKQQSPQPIIGLSPPDAHVVQISCGQNHTVALTKAGTVWTWGCGKNGKLGLGEKFLPEMKRANVGRPMCVESLKQEKIKFVTAGAQHCFAIAKENAKVYAWGSNQFGQLGLDVINKCKPSGEKNNGKVLLRAFYATPHSVSSLTELKLTTISSRFYHSIGIPENQEDGPTAWSWGDARWGKLGVGKLPGLQETGQISGMASRITTPKRVAFSDECEVSLFESDETGYYEEKATELESLRSQQISPEDAVLIREEREAAEKRAQHRYKKLKKQLEKEQKQSGKKKNNDEKDEKKKEEGEKDGGSEETKGEKEEKEKEDTKKKGEEKEENGEDSKIMSDDPKFTLHEKGEGFYGGEIRSVDGQTHEVGWRPTNIVTCVATGLHHSFATLSDGSLHAWGDNRYGITGLSEKMNEHCTIVPQVVSHFRVLNRERGYGYEKYDLQHPDCPRIQFVSTHNCHTILVARVGDHKISPPLTRLEEGYLEDRRKEEVIQKQIYVKRMERQRETGKIAEGVTEEGRNIAALAYARALRHLSAPKERVFTFGRADHSRLGIAQYKNSKSIDVPSEIDLDLSVYGDTENMEVRIPHASAGEAQSIISLRLSPWEEEKVDTEEAVDENKKKCCCLVQ